MKNEFSDFTSLDAMKNHPVSGQIDEVFKSVIKEEKKKPKASEVAQVAKTPETPDELSLEELEIDLSGGGDLPPAETPLDEGLDLSFSDDQSFELGTGDDASGSDSGGEQYGDLSFGGDDVGLSLDEGLPATPVEETPDLPDEDGLSLSDLDLGGDEGLDLGGDEGLDLGGDEGLDLGGDEGLDLGGDEGLDLGGDEGLDLGGDEGLDLGGDEGLDLGGDSGLDLGSDDGLALSESDGLDPGGDIGLDLGSDDGDSLSLSAEEPAAGLDLGNDNDLALNFGSDEGLSLGGSDSEGDLSEDAKKKLEEIDAIMDMDASQVHISTSELNASEDVNESLVSEDLDLGSINFSGDEEDEEEEAPVVKEAPKKKKKEPQPEVREAKSDRNIGQELKEISGAYSGEMERMQATISNLRSDREELLLRIQKLEEDKVLQSRQSLTMRAELDEKKIELTIIRKKLNEEINELKDRLKLHDEKRLILEEKNRILMQELEKAAQKNKFDVKKVQMRERELEQKLELLKSDAETQIRHRDLKILELKRKIDAMEFDMESISMQEKRSVESRFELEDKLEKAIKTLRSAITVLEDESDRSNALDALKKNIDM